MTFLFKSFLLYKFILSDLASEKSISSEFYEKIKKDVSNIENIELEYFKITTPQVSASMFKQWKLDNKLVNIIYYISDISTTCSINLLNTAIINKLFYISHYCCFTFFSN